jgi:hypothetical protein
VGLAPGMRKGVVTHRLKLTAVSDFLQENVVAETSGEATLSRPLAYGKERCPSPRVTTGQSRSPSRGKARRNSIFPQRLLARHICWEVIPRPVATRLETAVHNRRCARMELHKPVLTIVWPAQGEGSGGSGGFLPACLSASHCFHVWVS